MSSHRHGPSEEVGPNHRRRHLHHAAAALRPTINNVPTVAPELPSRGAVPPRLVSDDVSSGATAATTTTGEDQERGGPSSLTSSADRNTRGASMPISIPPIADPIAAAAAAEAHFQRHHPFPFHHPPSSGTVGGTEMRNLLRLARQQSPDPLRVMLLSSMLPPPPPHINQSYGPRATASATTPSTTSWIGQLLLNPTLAVPSSSSSSRVHPTPTAPLFVPPISRRGPLLDGADEALLFLLQQQQLGHFVAAFSPHQRQQQQQQQQQHPLLMASVSPPRPPEARILPSDTVGGGGEAEATLCDNNELAARALASSTTTPSSMPSSAAGEKTEPYAAPWDSNAETASVSSNANTRTSTTTNPASARKRPPSSLTGSGKRPGSTAILAETVRATRGKRSRPSEGSGRTVGATAEGAELAAFPSRTAAATLTAGTAVRMAQPSDARSASRYQCLLREQIEFFEADKPALRAKAQGRNIPIRLGQVGIRCVHCSGGTRAPSPLAKPNARTSLILSGRLVVKGAVYYPARTESLYQAVQNMANNHFANAACPRMPPSLVEAIVEARRTRPKRSCGKGKRYFSESAEKLGIVNAPDGASGMLVRRGTPAEAVGAMGNEDARRGASSSKSNPSTP